jgi:hypothetical protein
MCSKQMYSKQCSKQMYKHMERGKGAGGSMFDGQKAEDRVSLPVENKEQGSVIARPIRNVPAV